MFKNIRSRIALYGMKKAYKKMAIGGFQSMVSGREYLEWSLWVAPRAPELVGCLAECGPLTTALSFFPHDLLLLL